MKDKLEKQGWFVSRSAGSHGIDLIAITPDQRPSSLYKVILFISCKLTKYIPLEERKEFLETCWKYGALPRTTKKIKGHWELVSVEA